MGGKNHQPTNKKVTASSAWLSQQIGRSVINIQEANNHLEDAIMVSMDCLFIEDLTAHLDLPVETYLDRSVSSLTDSIAGLARIGQGYDRLFEVCEKIEYPGNPLASQLDRMDLHRLFEERLIAPKIDQTLWSTLVDKIKSENIVATLRWEKDQFSKLVAPTEALVDATNQCLRIAKDEGATAFGVAVENNQIPFRQHYARVFSRWNYLDLMFLYSALIMTELYYRCNGFGSLADFDLRTENAKIA